jgi:urease accessory protein UreF
VTNFISKPLLISFFPLFFRLLKLQGKAMADTAGKVFQISHLTSLKHRHYAVVFGAVCGQLGLSLQSAMLSLMSGVARTAIASAVRLDQLGPVEVRFFFLIM